RGDANPATHAFVASPNFFSVIAFLRDLTFNPLTESPARSDIKSLKFNDHSGFELPTHGCGLRC
ncbi:hypothetical protein BDV93DRAFT_444509, partial [Ceratobasidium sp. AG-I]